jgi:hypothetical protein
VRICVEVNGAAFRQPSIALLKDEAPSFGCFQAYKTLKGFGGLSANLQLRCSFLYASESSVIVLIARSPPSAKIRPSKGRARRRRQCYHSMAGLPFRNTPD